ncbi:MAG TPA: hypothetical protein VLW17_04700 [Thermoanaerobaculaceae bacterium]|nr:hypothetical protein [Thermoanaerobaculaceae bacterium]
MAETLTPRRIFRFWAPLAATWLMMSVEGPFLAAVIARAGEPKHNLAAWGVAFSFAMIVEAPIIMMMSAATALVVDRQSFLALRRFVYLLNALITAAMVVLLLPPVFRFVAETLIGLPHDVAALTHAATALLLPWPAAIGYRRFYQGTLIRHALTRRVAYGTVVRVASMAATATLLFTLTRFPGAWVGGAALAAGVVTEAAASRWMAAGVVRGLLHGDASSSASAPPLTTRGIVRFYYPLALTSLLTLGVNPLVTFFLGRSRMPLESLAAMPVVAALVFAFRSPGVAYQEVGIALLGERREGYAALRRFAAALAAAVAGALVLVAWTPLAVVWFHRISGLTPELTRFALVPLRVLCFYPALEVLLSFQRSLLVHAHRTAMVTWATAVEVAGIVAALVVGIGMLDLVGAVGAAAALLLGRLAANALLALAPLSAQAAAGSGRRWGGRRRARAADAAE